MTELTSAQQAKTMAIYLDSSRPIDERVQAGAFNGGSISRRNPAESSTDRVRKRGTTLTYPRSGRGHGDGRRACNADQAKS